MTNIQNLYKFVDAVIAGDEQAEKEAFKIYTEVKTQEILGLTAGVQFAEPEAAITGLSEETIATLKSLLEVDLGDGIEISNSGDIFINGKKVGRIEYSGDDFDQTMMFTGIDGRSVSIRDNDIQDLVMYLRKKYLGKAS